MSTYRYLQNACVPSGLWFPNVQPDGPLRAFEFLPLVRPTTFPVIIIYSHVSILIITSSNSPFLLVPEYLVLSLRG